MAWLLPIPDERTIFVATGLTDNKYASYFLHSKKGHQSLKRIVSKALPIRDTYESAAYDLQTWAQSKGAIQVSNPDAYPAPAGAATGTAGVPPAPTEPVSQPDPAVQPTPEPTDKPTGTAGISPDPEPVEGQPATSSTDSTPDQSTPPASAADQSDMSHPSHTSEFPMVEALGIITDHDYSARNNAPSPTRLSTVIDISVDHIAPSPYQPRLEEMAVSIRAHGVLQPISVRVTTKPKTDCEHCELEPGCANCKYCKQRAQTFELIAGERRLRAAKLAGLPTIPAIIHQLTDQEAAELTCVENLQREDLHPLEQARMFATLRDLGMTQTAIAQRTGRSQPQVAHYLGLLKLPEETQALLAAGKLTVSHAKALNRYAHVPAVLNAIAEFAISHNWAAELLEEKHLASSRLPNILTQAGVAVSLNGWYANSRYQQVAFDTSAHCKKCSKREQEMCFDSSCFNTKQQEAKIAQEEKIRALVEEARTADNYDYPVTSDLGDYANFSYMAIPTNCKQSACPSYNKACTPKGKIIQVCIDRACYNLLDQATTKSKNKARRDDAKAKLAQAEQTIRALADITSPLACLALAITTWSKWDSSAALKTRERAMDAAGIPETLRKQLLSDRYGRDSGKLLAEIAQLDAITILKYALMMDFCEDVRQADQQYIDTTRALAKMVQFNQAAAAAPPGPRASSPVPAEPADHTDQAATTDQTLSEQLDWEIPRSDDFLSSDRNQCNHCTNAGDRCPMPLKNIGMLDCPKYAQSTPEQTTDTLCNYCAYTDDCPMPDGKGHLDCEAYLDAAEVAPPSPCHQVAANGECTQPDHLGQPCPGNYCLNPEPGTCRICGCTDDHACDHACYWMEPERRTLCSRCIIPCPLCGNAGCTTCNGKGYLPIDEAWRLLVISFYYQTCNLELHSLDWEKLADNITPLIDLKIKMDAAHINTPPGYQLLTNRVLDLNHAIQNKDISNYDEMATSLFLLAEGLGFLPLAGAPASSQLENEATHA